MVFHVLTIFREFFQGPFDHGVVARARKHGHIDIRLLNLRDYTSDSHCTVDDRPFGGGEGMVLKVEPIDKALKVVRSSWVDRKTRTVLLSAQGELFNQAVASRLATYDEIALVCGRYEGVDERVSTHLVDEELSVGNFVVTGGEWAAGIVIDSVARLLPGVLGNEASSHQESFAPNREGTVGILDFPQYTRPARYSEWDTPDILLGGHHEKIRRWRRRAALEKTSRNRPDLLASADLSEEEGQWLQPMPRRAAKQSPEDD